MEANIALLRFYQYNPSTAKVPLVCKVLMKALMQLPGTDFMLCLYLLPVAVQKDKQVEELKALWDKLETCQFKVSSRCHVVRH
jgi:translation initiation factor 3 subunit K